MIVPVILSGGSGTRLWPLSRPQRPKQLLPLVTERSLFQDTILRLDALDVPMAPPIIVCNESHASLILKQLESIGRPEARLILEPKGRNTAPAAAVAALLAEQLYPGENPSLLVLPADHVIADPGAFAEAAELALDAAVRDGLVTFGITPTQPETGYGYIKRSAMQGKVYSVECFVEKPEYEQAQTYLESGDYYWNGGMFMFTAGTYLSELEKYSPEILEASRNALSEATEDGSCIVLGRDSFLACPGDSIDYAVMEHTTRAMVTPLEAGWSDVGSWASLHDASAKDSDGNVALGETITLNCRQSYLRGAGRLVVGIGLDEVVVVDTPEALLVMSKAAAQDVKKVVSKLETACDRPESMASSVGGGTVIDSGAGFDVSRIELDTGESLNRIAGADRNEHWVVVSGTGRATMSGQSIPLVAGETIRLEAGGPIQLENQGEMPLTLIFVAVES